jgi:anti-sigma B factor antagonist
MFSGVLTVSRQTTDQAVIVTAAGDVDMLTVDRLRSAMGEGLLEPVSHPVIVDLSKVTFLSSRGLDALVQAAAEARRQNEPLRIVVDDQHCVIRPLEITGLDRVLALYRSVEDAISGRTRG